MLWSMGVHSIHHRVIFIFTATRDSESGSMYAQFQVRSDKHPYWRPDEGLYERNFSMFFLLAIRSGLAGEGKTEIHQAIAEFLYIPSRSGLKFWGFPSLEVKRARSRPISIFNNFISTRSKRTWTTYYGIQVDLPHTVGFLTHLYLAPFAPLL